MSKYTGNKLATYEDDRLLDELNFQFLFIERSITALQAAFGHEKAAHIELKIRFEALEKKYDRQVAELKTLRQETRNLKAENKQLREKELSLKEKLNNFKQLSIIVKNQKNTDAITQLNTKLDDYIRYVEETIALLKTL